MTQPTIDPPKDELETLALAWLLDPPSSPVREAAEARLKAHDEALEAAVRQASEALAVLAEGVATPPPPPLKARVLNAVRATPLEQRPTAPDRDLEQLAVLAAGLKPHQPPEGETTAPPRRALLVIDMLHDYVDEGAPMEMPMARAIVQPLRQRLAVERSRGTPIIYINDRHSEDDPDFRVWPRHAVRGTAGARVIPPLAPQPQDRQLDRVSYSAFFETGLESLLNELGVTDLILAGQAADACVMMTAVDALMRGFRVEVPEQCVAGTTEEGKTFALRRIALLQPYQAKRKR